jgi:serine/threonine-protein kinase
VYECNLLPDHRPWIAMELVEGETLANRLHYASTLPALEVANLLASVADVLATSHKNDVIHRDLKPDNILCTPTNGDYAIRVLDWGVARLGPIGRLTLDGLTPGTPIYMSPEQATGVDIGPACDIYSLGVIAYEALTGEPPFDGRTLAEVVYMHLTRAPASLRRRCNAPLELCELVGRMLEKDPALRPTAVEVRQLCGAIAKALAPYEEFEVQGGELETRTATRCRSTGDELEFGVTEMVPVAVAPRAARWTPDFAQVPSALAAQRNRLIGPRAPRDQVAGEIILKPR